MSKGLGSLQREILEAIATDGAKYVAQGYSDVYSLQDIKFHLALVHGKTYSRRYVKSSFQASFSRAIKGLVKRGMAEHGRYYRYIRVKSFCLNAYKCQASTGLWV